MSLLNIKIWDSCDGIAAESGNLTGYGSIPRRYRKRAMLNSIRGGC